MINIDLTFRDPFPIVTSQEVLDSDLLTPFECNAHHVFAVDLQKQTGNPKDSDKRKVVKLVDSGVKHPSICQSLYEGLVNMGAKMTQRLSELDDKLSGAYDYENLTVLECWDERGYENPTHVDSKKKIWTGVVYLFGDGKNVEGGTSFYKKNLLGPDNSLTEFHCTKPIFNGGVCFRSTPESYHSVNRSDTKRHVLIVNYNKKRIV